MSSLSVEFSHVHIYVDRLEDLAVYKQFEEQLNELGRRKRLWTIHSSYQELSQTDKIQKSRELWQSIIEGTSGDDVDINVKSLSLGEMEVEPEKEFNAHNRDVVRQMIAGFGFRILGACYPGVKTKMTTTNSRSLLLTSRDPKGIQVLVTAIDPHKNEGEGAETLDEPTYHHLDASRVRTFYSAHHQRQGIAVLAFWVDDVQSIYKRYQSLHPKLVSHYQEYNKNAEKDDVILVKMLEVFSFYQEHKKGGQVREADKGTVLRFMQMLPHCQKHLPGLETVEATFDEDSHAAYCDHWVSNVINRTEFLEILHDTLDFEMKVDFNAGVVAAGEAQIESTVAGNSSTLLIHDKEVALRDQSQVYLPINNALSQVGHVHSFLQEIGQGVQHVASRVNDLVSFVQQVNDQRRITGEGFTFLNIPRSYYGVLTLSDLKQVVSIEYAPHVWEILEKNHLLALDGAVDLDLSEATLDATILSESFDNFTWQNEYTLKKDELLQTILLSRYRNLYGVLGERLTGEKYLAIVRNQILVDIQGDDLLYQIFTCKVLHRQANEEAPFFEFIQRVCSEDSREDDEHGCRGLPKIRPGCGGFGIRNFLTLFLSIEVSKAMRGVANARASGDEAKQIYEQTRVDYFTAQLNESNPILTEISNAMKDEGRLRQRQLLEAKLCPDQVESIAKQIQEASERKHRGNMKLMAVSAKYNDLMKALRMTL